MSVLRSLFCGVLFILRGVRSLFCGVCVVLGEKRTQLLSPNIPENGRLFVTSVRQVEHVRLLLWRVLQRVAPGCD